MKLCYLAGPISGLSYGACTDWREYAMHALDPYGIIGLSPMRGKEYLSHLKSISPDGRDYASLSVLSLPAGVTQRDRYDTQRADVVLMNLLGATKVSIGTMIEAGWADSARRPIVLVMEPGNPHEHMILETVAGYRVSTLDEALHVVKAILTVSGL